MKQKPIFLIGARGSGKSTIGKTLAKHLNREFIDTDSLIEKQLSCSITQMVKEQGWDFFRTRESEILRQCIQNNSIVSTGGGMVLAKDNRDFMRAHGIVCFLDVPAKELGRRLLANTNDRPALTSQGTIAEVESVLKERLPLYLDAAHMVLDASLPIDKTIANICKALNKHSKVCIID